MIKIPLIAFIFLFPIFSWSQKCIDGDCINESGIIEWTDGSQFISDFKDGKPQGIGKIILANGDEVIGKWVDDHFYSEGVRNYPDGSYLGEFKDNMRHRQGTFSWFDGGKYIGGWKDDKRHGIGICMGKNLIHSSCEWKDGIAQYR